jgi:hypothetical protein
MGGRIAFQRTGIEADGLIPHRRKPRASPRFGTREKRYVMAHLDQGIAEPGDDALGSAIESWRNGFVQWSNLCNFHIVPLRRAGWDRLGTRIGNGAAGHLVPAKIVEWMEDCVPAFCASRAHMFVPTRCRRATANAISMRERLVIVVAIFVAPFDFE